MRILASILIQPHLKKGCTMPATRLVPMPWDKKKAKVENRLTPEQQRRRMEKLVARLGDKL